MTRFQVTYVLVSLMFHALCPSLSNFGTPKIIAQENCVHVILALAYRSCHLLGYNKKIAVDIGEQDVSLESELRRRCFWACWVSTCIVMAPEPYIRSAWQEASTLPLPACIRHTEFGYEITLSEKMDRDWNSTFVGHHESIHFPEVAASIVKMVGIW